MPFEFSAKAVYPCIYAGFITPDAYNAMLRKICQQEKHDFYCFFCAPDFVQGIWRALKASFFLHFRSSSFSQCEPAQ